MSIGKFKKYTKISKKYYPVWLLLPIFFFGIFGVVKISFASITFTDHFWSTSFSGCTTGNAMQGYSCDGIEVHDNYTCNGVYSQVDASGNYSGGGGGNGYRIFMNTVQNDFSTPMRVVFQNPQKEFWLRYYYRIPSGQYMSGPLRAHKILYAFSNYSPPNGTALNINWPLGDNSISIEPRYTDHERFFNNGGWATMYGSGDSLADGSWHYFEFRLNMGERGQNNGIVQMWIDGTNRINVSDIDFYNSGVFPEDMAWANMVVPSNHNIWALTPACTYSHDVDDLAVALPEYSGFVQDGGGRNMIGAYSSGSSDTVPPAAPSGLSVN